MNQPKRKSRRQTTDLVVLALLLVLLVGGSGCGLLIGGRKAPAKAQIATLGRKDSKVAGPIAQVELQGELERFSDQYTVVLGQALETFETRVDTAKARYWARNLLLNQGAATFTIAAGPNPAVNLLDMVVMVSLARLDLETYWLPQVYGDSALPLLETYRKLEAQIWLTADKVLQPEQQTELHEMIHQWRAQNPDVHEVSFIRFREFAAALGQSVRRESAGPGSLFDVFFLDPLASLDPSTRAIEQSRQLAERAMYYGERLPWLLRWQGEIFLLETAQTPELKRVLSDATQFSQAAKTISEAAQRLPQDLADQREAAIQQALAGIAMERTNLFVSLAAEEERLGGLLTELRQTLMSGTAVASTVSTAAVSISGLVSSLDRTTSNAEPFRIRDYAETAARIEAAAERLNVLALTLDQKAPALLGSTEMTARSLANHIFKLSVWLVIILFAAALGYRWITRKWFSNLGPTLRRHGGGGRENQP